MMFGLVQKVARHAELFMNIDSYALKINKKMSHNIN